MDQRAAPGAAPVSGGAIDGTRVAYLVNQYPKVSHSFIRREIEAVEAHGVAVERIALRGWDEPLVDERDIAERRRTTYLLQGGLLPLLSATAAVAVKRPRAFAAALGSALRMSFRSTNALPYHLVYLAHACRILQILRERPVSHLHAHFGTNPAEVALLLRLLGGPPFSFTIHGADEADDGKYLHFDSKVNKASFVVAVSAYTRAQLLRHVAPADWAKVQIVHCGLEEDSFSKNEPVEAPVFVCVGRLSPEKGHLVLLDAFASLVSRHPDARLTFAGDGPLRPMIESRIASLGLANHIRITGWIDSATVREEIRSARVLVQPSFQEGLPVVIMEAMAQCRPVISTYVGGIPELVLPGETGWLVPAGDAVALAAAMERSLTLSRDQLSQMGEAGYRRVQDRHALDVEAEKLVGRFRQS